MTTPMMWRAAITASRISLKQPWIYVRLLSNAVSEETITHFGYKSVTVEEKAKKGKQKKKKKKKIALWAWFTF